MIYLYIHYKKQIFTFGGIIWITKEAQELLWMKIKSEEKANMI